MNEKELEEIQWNLKLSVIKMLFSKNTFIKSVDVSNLDLESDTSIWTIEACDNRDKNGL